MAIGNMVGRTIKFEDWKGDARSGRVISILDNGDYEVSTDNGMALVSNDEIIKMRKGGYVPKSKKLTARQQAKLEKVLHEFKMGELHSGSKTGPIVKSRKQALAIGLAEARSMAKGGEVGDVKTYKLRAEGLNDFLAFLQQGMYMKIKSFTVEPIGIPDVVVTFITDSSLSEIKSKLKKVPDSHVMLETVKPINEYTGDRDGEEYAKGGLADLEHQFDYELKVQHDYPYKNIANRWLEDTPKDSLKYKLAVLILREKNDPDEILGIKDENQYARLLRSLEKAKGESKHEMAWRTNNYNLYDAEKWTRESLREIFYIHGTKSKMARGGSVKELSFDNSNLYFYGFGRDTNGNTVVKVGFPNQKAFSIQINNPQFRNTYSLKSNKVSEISESDLNKIEKEVVDYIKSFGSAKQKSTLKVYSGLKMAQGGSVDKELIDASAKSIYDKKGMMALRNTFLQVAQTDEKAGDKSTADYRRKVVADYQSKQPKFMAQGGEVWKKGSTTSFKTKIEANSRLKLMKEDDSYKNLKVDKTTNGWAVKFDYKDKKMAQGGGVGNNFKIGDKVEFSVPYFNSQLDYKGTIIDFKNGNAVVQYTNDKDVLLKTQLDTSRLTKTKMAKGGSIKVGDKVTLPEIRMKNGDVQFEKVENGEVLYISDGIYGVKNPKTNRIHQVTMNQIKMAKGGSMGWKHKK